MPIITPTQKTRYNVYSWFFWYVIPKFTFLSLLLTSAACCTSSKNLIVTIVNIRFSRCVLYSFYTTEELNESVFEELLLSSPLLLVSFLLLFTANTDVIRPPLLQEILLIQYIRDRFNLVRERITIFFHYNENMLYIDMCRWI
jgi:hypothetical protein